MEAREGGNGRIHLDTEDDDVKKSVSIRVVVSAELKHVYYICRCVPNRCWIYNAIYCS